MGDQMPVNKKNRILLQSFLLIIFSLLIITNIEAATIEYTYDSLSRLTKAITIDGAETTTIEYSYDNAGNIVLLNHDNVLGDPGTGGETTLFDVMTALEVVIADSPAHINLTDSNGDGKINLIDAIHLLEALSDP